MTVLDRPHGLDVLFAADSRSIVSRLKRWELFDLVLELEGLKAANITDLVWRADRY